MLNLAENVFNGQNTAAYFGREEMMEKNVL
jgi:hypothetical protein